MLRKLLAERGIALTEELSQVVIHDIRFNKISFEKRTSLKELLAVIERCDKALKRCA